jgi:formylglycine-generating enzyme required for sulfatase activity
VKVYRHERTGLEFVLVPGGSFDMGSSPSEDGHQEDEGPRHRVTVEPFLICRTECTQQAWDRIGGKDTRKWRGTAIPIERVTWDDSTAWCRKAGLRLPTEAEWEQACRAGATERYSFGDADSSLDHYAWFESNSNSKTHPAGGKRPNSFGLYDMHGNVWEWCEDTWHVNYSGAPGDGSAWLDSGPSSRVMRGGGWSGHAWGCRSANRNYYGRNRGSASIGFRPACSLPESE